MYSKMGFWLAGTALTCLFASTASAADIIERITVTAQKRSEDVQKVPIAITALEGDSLNKMGIIGVADLSTHIPSMRFATNPTGGEYAVTLRGIGSQNVTSGGDSPVAYNVDGVYQGRTTAVDPEFFDIDRVEVLRGPQGTLYGRNSVGGSINVITKHPTDEFEAYGDVMAGNYDAWTFRGLVGGNLIDNGSGFQLNGRLTGVRAMHEPYQENTATNPGHTEESDGQDFDMLRGQLGFEFGENGSLLLAAYMLSNDNPVATKLAWGTAPLPAQARFVGQVYDPDPRKSQAGFPDTYNSKNKGFSATLEWDFDFATFTSVSAYTDGKWAGTNDADSSVLDIAHEDYWNMSSKQYSEEIRLASNDEDSAFKWIAGFFYFSESVGQGFQFRDTGLNAPVGTGFIFTNGGDIDTTSWAPFGQVDFDLGKTSMEIPLTITVGLRYTHDEKDIDDFLIYEIPDFAFVLAQDKVVSNSWSQTTGKVGLAYQFNDDVMAYANISRGYLAGGELVGNFPGVYDPETVTNYEVGLKTQFADNMVQLNLAAFKTKIKDMQVFVQDIAGSRVDNAGRAHVNGFEAEALAFPVENLRVNLGVSLMEAEYDEYFTINNRFAAAAPGCDIITRICDFAGNRLVQTPEWTVSLGAEYDIETELGTFTPRADIFFSGDLYFLSANSPFDRQDAYTLTNLHLVWNSPDEKWTADLFVNNASDEDIISGDGLQSNSIGLGYGIDNYTYMPPRTIGLRIGARF